jgi:uncharacterized protein YecE (DUF72 family)
MVETLRSKRREEQRARNPVRAAEMHAARLAWGKNGLFPDLGHSSDVQPPRINIGCSGWFYWKWREGFYPQDLPTSQWFPYYAERFETVELNAPFYSWPTISTVKSWIRQVRNRSFIYTVKVSELITHMKRFDRVKTLIRDFGHIADLLGPKMGCFLYQLPPSFDYSPARLTRIVNQLEPGRRNVVEFRHASWWNERVYGSLRDCGAIFCSCSGPRLPDQLIRTSEEIYLRFHGVKNWYRHDYSEKELAVWARRIRDSGAKRIWAYFNNDFESNAVRNAIELQRQLRTDD